MIKKNYLKILFSTIATLYLLVAVTIYSLLNNYAVSEHRLFDLRPFPEQYRASLSYLFIDKSFEKKVDVLCMGDSQAYGYMYPNEYVFSAYIEKKLKKEVLNISVQDGRLDDQVLLLNYMSKHNYKVDTLILSVNIQHSGVSMDSRKILDVEKQSNYLIGMFQHSADFTKLSLRPNPSTLPVLEHSPLTGGKKRLCQYTYVDEYISKLNTVIELTKKVSKKQLFYIEPYAPSSFKYNNCDTEVTEKVITNILELCSSKNVYCTNYQNKIHDNKFRDLVHLNIQGHKKLSNLIESDLEHLNEY